jgi:hypothetical protein
MQNCSRDKGSAAVSTCRFSPIFEFWCCIELPARLPPVEAPDHMHMPRRGCDPRHRFEKTFANFLSNKKMAENCGLSGW